MVGKILSTVGGVYEVYLEDKSVLRLTPRGILKHKKIKLLVGDNVIINPTDKTIDDIVERKNELVRPRIANIDLGVIVMSLENPSFSSYLVDKFLTLLNLSNIKPLLVLTKRDLLTDEEKIKHIYKQYELLGVEVMTYSSKTLEGLDAIKDRIKGLTIAFMGQTGVGKSSLINLIDAEYDREIGEYSVALGRGKHQTKEVILLPYNGGFIGDTPGFSSLELDIFKEELAQYFPFAHEHYEECRYGNCLHQNEPGCKVTELMNEGKFDRENYENYLHMLGELIFRKDRYGK
jgi:ribosome biogenesis GTPase